MAKFSLTESLYKTSEDYGSVYVCIELKSCIYREVTLELEFSELTAYGEFILISVLYDIIIYHTCYLYRT